MANTFPKGSEQPGSGINALAAEIKALGVRRQARTEALVRLSTTPGVAATLSLFR